MGRVVESFEFRSQDGREFHVDLGTNDAERNVIAIYMRIMNARDWHPVLEMDIDVESYFRESKTDMPPPGTRDGNPRL